MKETDVLVNFFFEVAAHNPKAHIRQFTKPFVESKAAEYMEKFFAEERRKSKEMQERADAEKRAIAEHEEKLVVDEKAKLSTAAPSPVLPNATESHESPELVK